ncbi:MAG: transporter, partial [Muribaculaceae bacterium]|nr:transporter [Muribaculaceae bacterium]
IATHQSLSFYIWAVSLLIVVGKSVSFVMSEPAGAIPVMIAIAGASLVVCIIQFVIGRRVGRRFGDPVAGAQGLAQKNTVLAIWMALNFLNPISSVGPASYILWQNTINSGQLYFKTKRKH